MCSAKHACYFKTLLLIFNLLLGLGLVCVGSSPSCAEEGRYPGNFSGRLITEREVAQITSCKDQFREQECERVSLLPPLALPMGDLDVASVNNLPVRKEPLPKVWELPPFASIGPPVDFMQLPQRKSRAAFHSPASAQSHAREGGETSINPGSENSDTGSAEHNIQVAQTPGEDGPSIPFQNVVATPRTADIVAPNLRPRRSVYAEKLRRPNTELPIPFSVTRYNTQKHGFFQIAVYGNDMGLFAESDFNTLKAAALNRRMLEGFGEKAFISFMPAPEPEKPFDLETAQGEFTFSAIAPKGEQRYDQVVPGLIKSSQAPTFKALPVTELPVGFEDELRRQLAADPYKNIMISQGSTLRDSRAAASAATADSHLGQTPGAGDSAGSAPTNASLNDYDRNGVEGVIAGSEYGLGSTGSQNLNGTSPYVGKASIAGSNKFNQPSWASSAERATDGPVESYDDAANAADSDEQTTTAELNPFAVKTSLSKELNGLYIMVIYYPRQSLVCELAADARFADLRSFLDLALLVQSRIQRW